MTAWRKQSFWSKVGAVAYVALLMLIPGYCEAAGLGRSSYGRKRVFSPGFFVLCIIVAVVELLVLNHWYAPK